MDDRIGLVAQRFVPCATGDHLDLATGTRVWLEIAEVGPGPHPALSEAFEILFTCRHPALAPCLDFGPLDESRWFQASEPSTTSRVGATSRSSLCDFLASQGLHDARVQRRGNDCRLVASLLAREGEVVRQRRRGVWSPVGLGQRLVESPLVRRLVSRLDALPGGPSVCLVDAPHGSGWRTCWRQFARLARLRGHVAIASTLLGCKAGEDHDSMRSWLERLSGRPLVVAHEAPAWNDAARADLAALTLLSGPVASGGVLVVVAVRNGHDACDDSLEPLTGSTRADALKTPGRARFASPLSEPGMCVREGPADAGATAPSGGLVAVASWAIARAEGQRSHGRAAAGRRLLRREAARLGRRGEQREGARLWARLAVECAASRRVGEADHAWRQAWRAVERLDDPAPALEAAPALARALLQDGDVVRAESVVRGALESHRVIGMAPRDALTEQLAEILCWRACWRDVRSMLTSPRPTARALRARATLSLGDVDAAVYEASAALSAARDDDDRATIFAIDARLRVDAAVGDRDHAEALLVRLERLAVEDPGLRIERDLLMLEALACWRRDLSPQWQARATALSLPPSPRLVRARARIVLSLLKPRTSLPALIEQVRRVALATGLTALDPTASAIRWPWPAVTRAGSPLMVHDIVAILEACQQDGEPRAAAARVGGLLIERAGAHGVAAIAGRGVPPWTLGQSGRPVPSQLGSRAIDLGAHVGPEHGPEGWDAAWPIRQGRDILGALVCRWQPAGPSPGVEALSLAEAAASALSPVVALAVAPVARPASGDGSPLLGNSPAMTRVRQAIDRAAPVPFTVLIEGESGAGKELVANAIHSRGPRGHRKFCAINCAALTDELFEAELFGHARGAFTGAMGERPGLFEEADGGTLFLDEVSELSPRAQAKILRALQEGEIRRLGEARLRHVDVRIVAATNRSLADDVARGRFRADLRFRLDVIRIELPPLRQRPDDIAPLAQHFWQAAADRVGSRAVLGAEVLAALARYDWPGNVRELQNVLAAMAVNAPRRGALGRAALPDAVAVAGPGKTTLDQARREFDTEFVRAALARAGGCRTRAATDLGVTRQGLAKLIDRLGLVAGADISVPA